MLRRIIFILCLCLWGTAAYGESQQLLDRVVAVVNDEIITQSELDTYLRAVYEEYMHQYHGEEFYQKINEARLKILNQLIEDRLVFQEAKAKEVEVSNSEIEEDMEAFRSRFPNQEAMEKALEEQGMTLKDIRERVRKQTLIRRLHDMEVRSKIVVSPMEVQNFYNENPDQFNQKEKVKIRSLTIRKSEEAREKGIKDEEAWQVVEGLRKEILGGKSFAEVAKEKSEDAHADKGGEGDWIERGQMIPAIDQAIFSLGKGQVSEIIETSMGYHLFMIEDKVEGAAKPFDEVRDQIFAYLFAKKSDERFDAWMTDLKSKAYISIR